jgi:hypothetical protein
MTKSKNITIINDILFGWCHALAIKVHSIEAIKVFEIDVIIQCQYHSMTDNLTLLGKLKKDVPEQEIGKKIAG